MLNSTSSKTPHIDGPKLILISDILISLTHELALHNKRVSLGRGEIFPVEAAASRYLVKVIHFR